MTCLCKRNHFLRDPYKESQQGKYPWPNHHPDCDAYKLEEFRKLSFSGGGSFIGTPEEAEAYLEQEGNPEQYTVTTVMLTRDQFDRLPEFDGF